MERQIIWTERASSDIEAIVRYIARRDRDVARRIELGIYDRAQILARQPKAGSMVSEIRSGGWRKLIFAVGRLFIQSGPNTLLSAGFGRPAMGEVGLETPLRGA